MSSSTQSSFDPTLKLSSIPSKQIRHTDHEQLKSVFHLLLSQVTQRIQSITSPEIVYLTSQNHIPDQINCSSDRSHLQQTFHLSSNPLRMHNSSSSSASSSTDSWDFDPDLIIPDDSKKDTEDSTLSSSFGQQVKSSDIIENITFFNLVVLNLGLRMRMRNEVKGLVGVEHSS
ncbi:hypothetical protein BY996DRAFT_6506466 [Phakopsora pachyrhizi]|nr:hypothetical protein BY996DRAFT_6506466 [Phakopsora pachyrhizi]